jgi:hypothetical protein
MRHELHREECYVMTQTLNHDLVVPLSEDKRKSRRFNWPSVLWVAAIHAGALVAPFTSTWSGLVLCVAL